MRTLFKKSFIVSSILLILILSFSCRENSIGPTYEVNIGGVFTGTVVGTGLLSSFSMTATLTITQNGTTISGIWETSKGNSGTLTGTIEKNKIVHFTIQQIKPNAGTFEGNAEIQENGNKIVFSYAGLGATGSITASFERVIQVLNRIEIYEISSPKELNRPFSRGEFYCVGQPVTGST